MKKKYETSAYHKIFIIFLIAILPIFIITEYRLIVDKKLGKVHVENDFYASHHHETEDKHFVVVVIAPENTQWIEKNLSSITNQNYPHYEVLWIDPFLTEERIALIKKVSPFVKEKVKLFHPKNETDLYRIYYHEIRKCRDNDVIVHLEGRDWFSGNEVLETLNKVYANPDVWLAYGQYLEYPRYAKRYTEAKPKRSTYRKKIRRAPFMSSPLKTFYAKYFKQINPEGIEDDFFQAVTTFKTLFLPMVEMGKSHVRFIPEVLYIHNTGKGEHQTVAGLKEISRKGPFVEKVDSTADVIVLSEDSPHKLFYHLMEMKKYISGRKNGSILYVSSQENQEEYNHLVEKFPSWNFMKVTSFKEDLLQIVESSSPYFLVTSDHLVPKTEISISECVDLMRKEKAYGFYFDLGKRDASHNVFHEELKKGLTHLASSKGVYSWRLDKGLGIFDKPEALDFVLYKKLSAIKELQSLEFGSCRDLAKKWKKINHPRQLGLFFSYSPTKHLTDE